MDKAKDEVVKVKPMPSKVEQREYKKVRTLTMKGNSSKTTTNAVSPNLSPSSTVTCNVYMDTFKSGVDFYYAVEVRCNSFVNIYTSNWVELNAGTWAVISNTERGIACSNCSVQRLPTAGPGAYYTYTPSSGLQIREGSFTQTCIPNSCDGGYAYSGAYYF